MGYAGFVCVGIGSDSVFWLCMDNKKIGGEEMAKKVEKEVRRGMVSITFPISADLKQRYQIKLKQEGISQQEDLATLVWMRTEGAIKI